MIEYMVANLGEVLETALARSPQFLMLFAAVAHGIVGIPVGEIEKDKKTRMPRRNPGALSDPGRAVQNLKVLAEVRDQDPRDVPARFGAFKAASGGTTQRIRSRRIRFLKLFDALFPEAV